jgi:hypothetical protein
MDNIKVLPDYQKWRDVIFRVTAEQVDVSSDQPDQVYGVVMDVGLADASGNPVGANAVITETAFASGESSLKTSFGGGIIGLGSMEEVSEHAKQIVRLAQPLISMTQPANSHDLPESGKIYFYLLTTSGTKFYGCGLKTIYSQEHPFREIFARFTRIKAQADKLMDEHSKRP